MCLKVQQHAEIPAETTRVAHAAFPKGSALMRLRDELGEIFTASQFADLFPAKGQPAMSPGRLALVVVLQYWEGLTDRQAADAVRSRIDWKYALGLEVTDPGFDFSVLSEFRERLVEGRPPSGCWRWCWKRSRRGACSKPAGANAPIQRIFCKPSGN